MVLQLGEKAAEPETTVEDCVSAFGIKPLDISNKTLSSRVLCVFMCTALSVRSG